MTSNLRLVVLVLTLAYSLLLRPSHAFGKSKELGLRSEWLRMPQAKKHHLQVPRLAPLPPIGVRAARYARGLLGVPYSYGGDSPRTGFDCSGLVRFVYSHFGLRLPHSSYADYSLGMSVSRASLIPGDLVFFDGVGHVGMYVGGGRFIHAPHSGTDVQVSSLDDPWYQSRYDGARRVLVAGTRRLLHR